MKNQWLAYVIVAVISALAGVAIAGPPNNVGTEPTIIVPDSTVPATTVATTVAPTTTIEAPTPSTEPEVTTTTIEAPETTTTLAIEPEVDPAELGVVTANGAGSQGLATRVRDELRDAGYTETRATDGTTIVDETVVYFYPLLIREAAGVAEALDLDPTEILPIEEAPDYPELEGDQVVVYLGRDQT